MCISYSLRELFLAHPSPHQFMYAGAGSPGSGSIERWELGMSKLNDGLRSELEATYTLPESL